MRARSLARPHVFRIDARPAHPVNHRSRHSATRVESVALGRSSTRGSIARISSSEDSQ